jgi:hypothetical protein
MTYLKHEFSVQHRARRQRGGGVVDVDESLRPSRVIDRQWRRRRE